MNAPTVHWASLGLLISGVPEVNASIAEQVETDIKYAGYLSREVEQQTLLVSHSIGTR
jgi:tRNA U34 5-carboxymethylaminomethyl modifying enzyme MnmG/GidA